MVVLSKKTKTQVWNSYVSQNPPRSADLTISSIFTPGSNPPIRRVQNWSDRLLILVKFWAQWIGFFFLFFSQVLGTLILNPVLFIQTLQWFIIELLKIKVWYENTDIYFESLLSNSDRRCGNLGHVQQLVPASPFGCEGCMTVIYLPDRGRSFSLKLSFKEEIEDSRLGKKSRIKKLKTRCRHLHVSTLTPCRHRNPFYRFPLHILCFTLCGDIQIYVLLMCYKFYESLNQFYSNASTTKIFSKSKKP